MGRQRQPAWALLLALGQLAPASAAACDSRGWCIAAESDDLILMVKPLQRRGALAETEETLSLKGSGASRQAWVQYDCHLQRYRRYHWLRGEFGDWSAVQPGSNAEAASFIACNGANQRPLNARGSSPPPSRTPR